MKKNVELLESTMFLRCILLIYRNLQKIGQLSKKTELSTLVGRVEPTQNY